jgi:hypothetical protein
LNPEPDKWVDHIAGGGKMVAMNEIYLAMQDQDITQNAVYTVLGAGVALWYVGLAIIGLLAVLMPVYVYQLHKTARRMEKRMDVMLQHLAIYTQHVNAEEMRGRVRKP